MTEARRKTKILLLQQKKTFAELAKDCALAEATIHNVLDGQSDSRKSKQVITNALGAQIWDDVQVTIRQVLIPKGTEIRFDHECLAKQAEHDFRHSVRRARRKVVFIRPVCASIVMRSHTREAARHQI